MFFSPGCFTVPQTQHTNSVCQIQLYFIPSTVAGIRGQAFIRQATELSNHIPKTAKQKCPLVTLFWVRRPKRSVFFLVNYIEASAIVRATRTTPAKQQLRKSKRFSAEALFLTMLLMLLLLLEIVPSTKIHHFLNLQVSRAKPPSVPLALFCPRLIGKNSTGVLIGGPLLHLQMGQSGSRDYCWSFSYPVSVNSLV